MPEYPRNISLISLLSNSGSDSHASFMGNHLYPSDFSFDIFLPPSPIRLIVIVESLSRFFPQQTGIYHLNQEGARKIFVISVRLIMGSEDMETCIKSNEVRHPQGSHRMPVSQLSSPVDLFRGRFPFVNHLNSLVQHGNINACRKKSRVVFGNHVLFSQGLAQTFNRFHSFIGSEIAAY